MSATKTTDHEVIRHWAEERGGHPASVKGTEKGKEKAGLLRIDFPGYSGEETLAPISWGDFFRKFDEEKLAFLYEERQGRHQSRFCKIVSR